ncbi:MAG: ferric iron uptake transcriptional regulator [Zoogloeaceae bacterium]|jgi:Fur family ferric uptake transcriptional regulator|nr:ferric iron uptake transcriptional regulator [Zoogloeaceae bacterium]
MRSKPVVLRSHSLREAGLKVTLPRLKILELFEKSETRHLGAEDVYRQMLAEGLDMGLATVYRVLTQFEQAGILERHFFEPNKATFEISSGRHHDHLVCVDCGRVEEFCDEEIERLQNRAAASRGFQIEEHELYLYVRCIREDCPFRNDGKTDAA